MAHSFSPCLWLVWWVLGSALVGRYIGAASFRWRNKWKALNIIYNPWMHTRLCVIRVYSSSYTLDVCAIYLGTKHARMSTVIRFHSLRCAALILIQMIQCELVASTSHSAKIESSVHKLQFMINRRKKFVECHRHNHTFKQTHTNTNKYPGRHIIQTRTYDEEVLKCRKITE